MTGRDVRNARGRLGELWGLGRPLHAAELGRLLRLQGRDPGATVLTWEREGPSGPAAVAIEAMLSGWRPDHFDEAVRAAWHAST